MSMWASEALLRAMAFVFRQLVVIRKRDGSGTGGSFAVPRKLWFKSRNA
jgi:hypothetical protein